MSIIKIKKYIKNLSPEDRRLFNKFYKVVVSKGRMKIPEGMQPWVKKQFGSLKYVESQKIVKVMNKITFEGTLFNSLRASRPMEVKSDEDIKKIIEESKGDSFDNPETQTPEDVFGRIRREFTITASNIAKYDGLHEVLIFSRHNPLFFNEDELKDHIKTAEEWFKKAYEENKEAKYPFLMWNALFRSGASIVHGHMQAVLSEKMHYAKPEMLYRIWKKDNKYFEKWFFIHKALGIGDSYNSVKVFANLTPIKEKEVVIIAENLDDSFVSVLFRCLDFYINKLNVQSFNVGITLPPLDGSWKGFPIIARIVDRGELTTKTVDIGAMELYAGSSVVASDPFILFENLRKNLIK